MLPIANCQIVAAADVQETPSASSGTSNLCIEKLRDAISLESAVAE